MEKDKANSGELYNHMRRGKYNYDLKEYKGEIKNRKSINIRPEEINTRERLGDFEIDLIVGPKNKGAILTTVDRLSRFCMLKNLDSKHVDIVEQAILDLFKDYDVLSITSDNGNEFMNHENISEELDLDYYFTNPYASFERGSIENLNGLIKQYIPKERNVI
ncbi:IS30 family transposase [Francisella sp. 19X1-34]|uniref:IS30 family transposase n=1 Tax=Francisella sp. 19X1-34 TaxID=3087177 RepID=UPI002E35C92D|nr:IS30 family transposase [Francisella sp. 19X1-34]MED7789216.1 IS30 family transposase [Francisella sp. 19X1-34]